jgi:putative transposase
VRFPCATRHVLVDILGLLIANCVEPANMSDRRAGGRLLAGLAPLWPTIRTVIADAGHESRKLALQLRGDGWTLKIVQRKQRAFKVVGLTWIVERSLAWPGFNRRLSNDYERYVLTSETLLDIAAIRLMLNRVAPEWTSHTVSELRKTRRWRSGATCSSPTANGTKRSSQLIMNVSL